MEKSWRFLSRFTMHRSIFFLKKIYLSCAPSLYAHAHSIHLLNGGWIINEKYIFETFMDNAAARKSNTI